jgi:hypothetical protein
MVCIGGILTKTSDMNGTDPLRSGSIFLHVQFDALAAMAVVFLPHRRMTESPRTVYINWDKSEPA